LVLTDCGKTAEALRIVQVNSLREVAMELSPTRQDALLTRSEVAAIVHVAPKTVTRWADAGKLRSFRTVGGHRRFMSSEVLGLMAGVNADQRPEALTSSADAGASPASIVVPRQSGSIEPGHRDRTAARSDESAAAAAVVAEAVEIAAEAQADESAAAVTVTAAAVAAAAATAVDAAETAREARAVAAAAAADAIAIDAAETAAAIRLRAVDCAVKRQRAASRAAGIVASAVLEGSEREAALVASRLAATVKAAAVAAAKDTSAAAASAASAVAAAAADVAFAVSAAALEIEGDVARAAAAVQATATATARQVAADTDARATDAVLVARQVANAAASLEDFWEETCTSLSPTIPSDA
jgi:excisionase family DNA binding protein